MPVALPLGTFPNHQGCGEDAHAARSARQYPRFIHISDGKLHDAHALDLLILEDGAIHVMDRGYGPRPPRVDFARLHVLHLAGPLRFPIAKSIRFLASFTFSLYIYHQPGMLFFAALIDGDASGYLFYSQVIFCTALTIFIAGIHDRTTKRKTKTLACCAVRTCAFTVAR